MFLFYLPTWLIQWLDMEFWMGNILPSALKALLHWLPVSSACCREIRSSSMWRKDFLFVPSEFSWWPASARVSFSSILLGIQWALSFWKLWVFSRIIHGCFLLLCYLDVGSPHWAPLIISLLFSFLWSFCCFLGNFSKFIFQNFFCVFFFIAVIMFSILKSSFVVVLWIFS